MAPLNPHLHQQQIQNILKNFLTEHYGEELYNEMVEAGSNMTSYNVINFLKENNVLCSNENESIDPEFLNIVDFIITLFGDNY